jgi:hypothetical protein
MTEQGTNQRPFAGPEHQRLEIFIGKWINQVVNDPKSEQVLPSNMST